jgi:hypothetical protein
MKKPTWVKVIGVLGIIFGCLGLFGSMNMMIMPTMFDFQKAIFEAAMEEARHDPGFPRDLMDKIKEMWEFPDWFGTWAVVFGIAGLLVSGFYLLAAIWLLQLKRSADKIMMWALGVSISLALLQIITIIPACGFIVIAIIGGCVLSIVIDMVLLLVILTSDRSVFARGAVMADTPQPAP